MLKHAIENAGTIYCPSGHAGGWHETEVDKLRKQLAQEQHRANTLKEELRVRTETLIKAESAARRLKKRASAGVCPCCNRTVSQMARHMKSKHPEFDGPRLQGDIVGHG